MPLSNRLLCVPGVADCDARACRPSRRVTSHLNAAKSLWIFHITLSRTHSHLQPGCAVRVPKIFAQAASCSVQPTPSSFLVLRPFRQWRLTHKIFRRRRTPQTTAAPTLRTATPGNFPRCRAPSTLLLHPMLALSTRPSDFSTCPRSSASWSTNVFLAR